MFRNTLLARLVVAFTLSVGVFVAWGFIVFWGVMIYESAFPYRGTYQRLVFGSDGTPVIETSTYYQTSPPRYENLDGREYVDPSEDWENNRHSSGSLVSTYREWNRQPPVPATRFYAFHSMTEPATYWYFRHAGTPDGGAWFEGYSSGTRRLTGYIGIHGPVATRPEGADRFPVSSQTMTDVVQWSEQSGYAYQGVAIPNVIPQLPPGPLAYTICVATADNVYLVDLKNSTVRKLLAVDRPILAMQVTRHADRRSKAPKILVRTDKSILVFSEEFAQLAEYPLPPEYPSWYLTLLTAADGSAWVAVHPKQTHEIDSKLTVLHWTASGELLPPHAVELKPITNNQQDAWLAVVSLAIPSPATLTATVFGFAPYAMRQVDQTTWSEGVARCFAAGAGPSLIVLWLLSLGPAILAFRHARSEAVSQRERQIWFAFVLLIGPAAYLGYRFHRRWPRQLPCSAGGHTLPADHFDCPTCHAAWPLPAMKGIEVLEPAKA